MRADHEPREIVTRGVFYDLAAAAERLSSAVDRAKADQVVADGPMSVPSRPAGVRGDDAAYRRPLRLRRVQRKPLPLFREPAVEFGKRNARFRRNGQVVRRVVQDAIQRRQRKFDARFISRQAVIEVGAAADRVDRLLTLEGRADDGREA